MKNNSTFWRSLIGVILGIAIIYGAKTIANNIAESKAKPKTKDERVINKVYTQTVSNQNIPITIIEKGNLKALRKVELFSEVQGLLEPETRLVKPGRYYQKGTVLFRINDDEFIANLASQKSVLYNLIAQTLPDLKLDYPEAYSNWQNYLNSFKIEGSTTPKLPSFTSDREKYFINSRNIVTTYYAIKNLEERHKKYTIYAPFYCVVTEASVTPGALIRTGQQLGTILDPSIYELPLSIDDSYRDYLAIGKKVKLFNLERTASWTGKIVRINATIDPETQGVLTYVEVSGKGLKEGMFIEAEIDGKSISNGYEIPRKLLVNGDQIFVVEDNKLKFKKVDVAVFKERSAVVTNLSDGTVLLRNALPGAYEGMEVVILEDKESSNMEL